MLTKLFRYFIGILIALLIIFGILFYLYDKPLPTGESGPEADALAQRMLDALNANSYENATYVEWSFRGGRHLYKWNKQKQMVNISWGDYTVDLDLITPSSSIVLSNGNQVPQEKASELIADAQSNFNNDSFWLVAPYKVFDPGTKRFLVDLEDGSEGLLVTYTKGGDTPGDSYLWILDRSGIPRSFKLWVKIIPIDGLEVSWENWKKTDSGALLPSLHSFGPIDFSMGDVKAYSP